LEVGRSKNLKKAGPIKLIAVGGFVAVTHFANRKSTHDLDYFLDPTLPNLFKLTAKLKKAINSVSNKASYSTKWANDSVGVYAAGDRRVKLFNDSIAQGIVIYSGKYLQVYAGQWEWILERKLKRISRAEREEDVQDCVTILKALTDKAGGPLSRDMIKGWNTNIFDPITDFAFARVGTRYHVEFGVEGFSF
jgi:hypothetical protein